MYYLYIVSTVQKGKKDFEQSDNYEDVDNAHYTASPQALGEVKHIKRIHYDYASSGPVAVRQFVIEYYLTYTVQVAN